MPQYNIGNPAGSAWPGTFSLKNADRSIQDITGRTFKFVVRPTASDVSAAPAIAVTAVSSAQGVLTIDVPTATVAVSLTATAAALIGSTTWQYALWMDPGTATQTCVVNGAFTGTPAAAP